MTRLEHIGIAVSDPESVRRLLSELLGLEAYKVETVESERIDTHFVGAGDVKLELLESRESDSVIARFLERRGGGMHHLAFEVRALDDVLERATRLGLKPINAEPKEGADGKRIFFLHPKETYGILIEVCESDRFPGMRDTVSLPHGEVAVFLAGSEDAAPILLLHDAGRSSLSDFGGLIPRIEPYVRAVAFDAPGHGASGDGSPNAHFLKAADRHALAVLDHVGTEKAVVAGRGIGAAVAASVARRAPDRVRSLVFIDPNLLSGDGDVEAARRMIEEYADVRASDLASHLASTMEDASQVAVSIDDLADISCPILVCGTRSDAAARTLRLHEQLPHSSLAVVPPFEESDTAVAHVLVAFVESLAD